MTPGSTPEPPIRSRRNADSKAAARPRSRSLTNSRSPLHPSSSCSSSDSRCTSNYRSPDMRSPADGSAPHDPPSRTPSVTCTPSASRTASPMGSYSASSFQSGSFAPSRSGSERGDSRSRSVESAESPRARSRSASPTRSRTLSQSSLYSSSSGESGRERSPARSDVPVEENSRENHGAVFRGKRPRSKRSFYDGPERKRARRSSEDDSRGYEEEVNEEAERGSKDHGVKGRTSGLEDYENENDLDGTDKVEAEPEGGTEMEREAEPEVEAEAEPEAESDTEPEVDLWDGDSPACAFEFETAPAPPQRVSGRSTVYASPLSHPGALRRACLDAVLRKRIVPAGWLREDDPDDTSVIRICGKLFPLPFLFDNHPACKAQERDLERAEVKFRSARKEKVVGGELGSFLNKKRLLKSSAAKQRSYMFSATGKRTSLGNLTGDSCKRLRFMGDLGMFYENGLFGEDNDTFEYRRFASSELVKSVRTWVMHANAQQRLARGVAAACAREGRKRLLRTIRLADDAHRRGRRVFRDVMAFWRKEDKERLEERKKLVAEADAVRRKEAEEREEQRQKNKLKFLLGQSEAFSSFLQAKAKATAEAARENASNELSKADLGMESITGAENDEELRRKAEAYAADLVTAHRARLNTFDMETKKRREEAYLSSADSYQGTPAFEEDRPEKPPFKTDVMEERKITRAAKDGQGKSEHVKDGDIRTKDKPEIAPVKQPIMLRGKMKDYQLRGLSWLVSLYDQGINGILADEMGLGKTVQTISFLAYLAETEDNWGPFLVVTPKATLHNWQQEVTKFCPSLRVLPYWGSRGDRKELRKHWAQKRMYRRESEFHVCVTSYEILTTDEKHFPRVKWQYVVLDEAQAIKNSSSIRWKALLQFPCRNRLLLTGTPLQNKMSELWSLLHFIMPTIFDSHAEFADWFAKDIEGHAQQNKMLDKSTVERLRTLLDPFMLRRVKRDVEHEMPPKTEIEMRCDLTPRQRHLYSSIKANISMPELLQSILPNKSSAAGKASHGALMNLVMQLRKVCNHPETFERRSAVSPFQCQLPPPPSSTPLPHSVLLNNNGPPPLQAISFVTRASIEVILPRVFSVVRNMLRRKAHVRDLHRGLWSPVTMKRNRSVRSLLYLSGGLSISEGDRIVRSSASNVWLFKDVAKPSDEILKFLELVYGSWPSSETYIRPDGVQCVPPMSRPHRMLMRVRARRLAIASSVTLPSRGSPADILAAEVRLLRSSSVYIPRATAPPVTPYFRGDPAHSFEHVTPQSLYYPEADSRRPFAEQYDVWRKLLGDYGKFVGSAPIVMPEAGQLIADAGKMKVLDPLLKQLKAEGHKCLVYSQFTKVLDILEDYCGKCGFKFLRLDGQSGLSERRDMVANWQSNDELFIFLLSTRAGGVGINLTAADTVIFYDSDWNPTSDSQAMDRAHRLGQERPVTVYRLVTRGTIEERMLVRAKQKSRVNELVIKSGRADVPDMTGAEASIDDLATLLMGEEDISDKANMANVVKPLKNSAGEAPASGNPVFIQGKQPIVITGTLGD